MGLPGIERLLQGPQQLLRLDGIVPVAPQLGDEAALMRDALLAFANVALGLVEIGLLFGEVGHAFTSPGTAAPRRPSSYWTPEPPQGFRAGQRPRAALPAPLTRRQRPLAHAAPVFGELAPQQLSGRSAGARFIGEPLRGLHILQQSLLQA